MDEGGGGEADKPQDDGAAQDMEMDTGSREGGEGTQNRGDDIADLAFLDDNGDGVKRVLKAGCPEGNVETEEQKKIREMDVYVKSLYPDIIVPMSDDQSTPGPSETSSAKGSLDKQWFIEGKEKPIPPLVNVSCNFEKFDRCTIDHNYGFETVTDGYEKVSFDHQRCPGFFNDRRTDVRLFYKGSKDSERIRGTEMASTVVGRKCYSCESDLVSTHVSVQAQRPVLLVGDEYFPPIVGNGGSCLPVLRVHSGSPDQVLDAITEVFCIRSKKGKGRSGDIPDDLLIVLGLTSHLERVGVSCYIEDMENLARNLLDIFSANEVNIRVGLMAIPVDKEYCRDKPAFTRDQAALINIMKLSVSQNGKNWTTPLFYQASENVTNDADFVLAPGVGMRFKAGNIILGNQHSIQVLPSTLLTVKQGTKDYKPRGGALGTHTEFNFLTSLLKDIQSYLLTLNIFLQTPDVKSLARGVGEAIQRDHGAQQDHLLSRLYSIPGVSRLDLKSSMIGQGRILMYGSSQIGTLKDELSSTMTATTAGKLNSFEFTHLSSISEFSYAHEIMDEFGKRIIDPMIAEDQHRPIVILGYLSNSILSDRYGRPRIIVKKMKDPPQPLMSCVQGVSVVNLGPGKNSGKNKGPKIRKQKVVIPKFPKSKPTESTHCIEVELRGNEKIISLIRELEDLVSLVLEKHSIPLIICPLPRHFKPCCAARSHFPDGFDHVGYQNLVYEFSTFISQLGGLKDAHIIHPGTITGWNKPGEIVVKPDSIHLSDTCRQGLLETVAATIKEIRRSEVISPGRETEDRFGAEDFPMFSRAVRASGVSFAPPAPGRPGGRKVVLAPPRDSAPKPPATSTGTVS
jgi:hypothetical protein